MSTVSYALSGVRPVAEETRRRIMTAIAELGYHPNLLARGLAGQRTRVIALLFPSVVRGLSQVQLEFVNAAVEVASQHGYAFLLWTSPSEDGEILRLTAGGLVEGILLMEIRLHDPRVELLRVLDYPFCMIGHAAHNEGISFVDFDFDAAARVSVRHLHDLGHRNIGHLVYSPIPIELGYGPAVRTLAGIHAACQETSCSPITRICEADTQAGYQTMRALLEEYPSLTAAFISSDVLCAGAIQAVRERGMSIPQDFSIMSILTSRFAEVVSPPLTAIELPAAEMGRIGTDLLIRNLEGDQSPPMQLMLPPSLVVRHSTSVMRRRRATTAGGHGTTPARYRTTLRRAPGVQ